MKTIYTGAQLRVEVLAVMRERVKRGSIARKQYRRAYQIRWPDGQVRILGSSTKVKHNTEQGMLTTIIYQAAHKESLAYGGRNFCSMATGSVEDGTGCAGPCLGHTSGHLRCSYDARAWRTLTFLFRPDVWRAIVSHELELLIGRAEREGLIPGCRPNGCTDTIYEVVAPWMFKRPIQFYDYTKVLARFRRPLPSNYYLVASRSDENERECLALLRDGICNVAVVFRDLAKALRVGWKGFRVIDGSIHDCRPRDEIGVVVGLCVKGFVDVSNPFFVEV